MGAPEPGGSPHRGLLRGVSERAVLDALAEEGGPLTRAEMARRTGLSRPTVGDAVRRLEADHVLAAVGRSSGHSGTAATFYGVSPRVGVAVGVEVNQHVTRVAVGAPLDEVVEESEHPPTTTESLPLFLRATVRRLADRRIRAMTVSVAAPVDPADDRVIVLPEGGHPRGPVRPADLLEGHDFPVLVDNDVNLAALAERHEGVARDAASFVYLYVGEGDSLGLGVVVEDRVLRGAHGLAGEVGYLAVGHGRHALARAVGPADLARPEAPAATDALGRAVTSICALLDPALVVVGGPRTLHDEVLAAVARRVAADAPRPVPVLRSALGASATVRGALLVARRRAWADLREAGRGA